MELPWQRTIVTKRIRDSSVIHFTVLETVPVEIYITLLYTSMLCTTPFPSTDSEARKEMVSSEGKKRAGNGVTPGGKQ